MEEITLTGESLGIVSQNVEKMKQLFPEVIIENQIDFDKLKEVFGNSINNNDERFNFSWKGKSKAIKEYQKHSNGTLIPCKTKSKNWESTQNLYIEGDNLEVLKLLQKSYYNKIKMIYIDPPYNTGKDFIYSDDYVDNLKNYVQKDENGFKLSSNPETNGRFHTNWLNMMYPRLRLARNLLTDDGVIFLSIDDNEVENLKEICNEIYGKENELTTLIWNKQHSQQQGIFKKYHEFILVYCKNHKKVQNIKGSFGTLKAGALKKISQRNPASEFEFPKGVKFDAPEGTILKGVIGDSEKINIIKGQMICENGRLKEPVTISAGWTQKNQMNEFFYGNDDVYDSKGQKVIEFAFNSSGKLYCIKNKTSITPSSILRNYGMVSQQTKELTKLMGGNYFDTPKPVEMISDFIKWFTSNDDYILDFFGGSSTTAHSLLKVNSEDRMKRKFIIVQLPECCDEDSEAYKSNYKNICEIGEERIRRAGDKIIKESGNENLDIGFKVFKLDSSNLTKWNPDINNLENSLISNAYNIVSNRNELDLVYEIMLKYGIDLSVPVEEIEINDKKIYSVGFGALVICLNSNITSDLANDIIKIKNDSKSEIIRVVFKDNGFKSDSDKTNIKETLRVNGVEEFITF